MTEQWQELKETITEMRDNGGTGTQQEVCKFLANYMEILEKQMRQPCEDAISRKDTIEWLKKVTVTEGIEFKTGFEQILYDIEQMPSVIPMQSG